LNVIFKYWMGGYKCRVLLSGFIVHYFAVGWFYGNFFFYFELGNGEDIMITYVIFSFCFKSVVYFFINTYCFLFISSFFYFRFSVISSYIYTHRSIHVIFFIPIIIIIFFFIFLFFSRYNFYVDSSFIRSIYECYLYFLYIYTR